MSKATFSESIALLRSRTFGTFWFASFLSNIGTWAQQVAQPWLLLSLGASPFLLGLDSFALAAPVFFLTLIGGALADSADRRETILKYQSIQMLCPILIVILLALRATQPWMIIGLSLLVGITDGLSMPSFQSIVPSIVERKQISNGLALNATQFNLSRILGPAIAGMLMVSVGAIGAFGVSALSYVPFILVALWVLPKGTRAAPNRLKFDFRQMRSNVHHVVKQPILRGALTTVLISSLLCAPLVVFSPILIQTALNGDVSHFSLAVGSFGLGGLLGALSLLGLDEKRDRSGISSGFAMVYGLTVIFAAISRSLWMLPASFALAGYCMTMSNTSANTLLQSAASPTIRGQTVSLFMLAMRGGMALGSLLTGLTVSWIGVQDALLLDGILALILQGLIARSWGDSTPPNTGISGTTTRSKSSPKA